MSDMTHSDTLVRMKVLYFAGEPEKPLNQYIKKIGDIDNVSSWKFTPNEKKGMQMDFMDAMALYTKQSVVKPLRNDGKLNKPLTAFTIPFEPVKLKNI